MAAWTYIPVGVTIWNCVIGTHFPTSMYLPHSLSIPLTSAPSLPQTSGLVPPLLELGCQASYPPCKKCRKFFHYAFLKGLGIALMGSCESILEVFSCIQISIGSAIGKLCMQKTYGHRPHLNEHRNFLHLGMCPEYCAFSFHLETCQKTTPPFLVSVRIASSASTALTMTMLT